MACISKRRDRYVIDFYDNTGKRRWKTLPKGARKKDANKALRDINFDEEFEEDTNNCCGMCREQHVDIDDLPVVDHSAIIDLYKYKDERMKDLDLYEYSDYLLDGNSSINICECGLTETSSDYILRKVEYLKKIK